MFAALHATYVTCSVTRCHLRSGDITDFQSINVFYNRQHISSDEASNADAGNVTTRASVSKKKARYPPSQSSVNGGAEEVGMTGGGEEGAPE